MFILKNIQMIFYFILYEIATNFALFSEVPQFNTIIQQILKK
jgi:hypothetical protein